VKRPDPQVARSGADHPLEARLHLAGGLVGEGDGQDTVREDLLPFEEVGDPVREDAGLARACTGEDQHWAVCMLDGFALDVIEKFGLRQHQDNVRRERFFCL
jgi:hypothetical protein